MAGPTLSPDLRIQVPNYDIECVGNWCAATFRGKPYNAEWMESGHFLPSEVPRVIDELNLKIAEAYVDALNREITSAEAAAVG
jgi:hypothetical protein